MSESTEADYKRLREVWSQRLADIESWIVFRGDGSDVPLPYLLELRELVNTAIYDAERAAGRVL